MLTYSKSGLWHDVVLLRDQSRFTVIKFVIVPAVW